MSVRASSGSVSSTGSKRTAHTTADARKTRSTGALTTRRWTEEQRRALLDGIGSFGWSVLENRTQHTRPEIREKIRREFGGGGITRGSYSLAQAMLETGYSRSQLDRAAEALNQRWQRTARRGDYLITVEQIEDMVVWLQNDFWSKKHHLYNCEECGSSERRHFSGGLCQPCYRRFQRHVQKRCLQARPKALHTFAMQLSGGSGPDGLFLEQMRLRLASGRLLGVTLFRRLEALCSS